MFNAPLPIASLSVSSAKSSTAFPSALCVVIALSCVIVPDATSPLALLCIAAFMSFAFVARAFISFCHVRPKLSGTADGYAAPLTFGGGAADSVSKIPM
jgi:hypothetical protein